MKILKILIKKFHCFQKFPRFFGFQKRFSTVREAKRATFNVTFEPERLETKRRIFSDFIRVDFLFFFGLKRLLSLSPATENEIERSMLLMTNMKCAIAIMTFYVRLLRV